MKVRMITASFGSKLGLANYSNIEARVELSADVEDGDEPSVAAAELLGVAKEAVKGALRKKLSGEHSSIAIEREEDDDGSGY